MNFFKRLAALACLVLAGCGGGGDGHDGLTVGPLSSTAVTATVSNLRMSPGREVVLTAPYSGTFSGTVFVIVVDPDAVFSTATVDYDASSVRLHLLVDDNAQIGHYARPMTLHVCRDAACASELASFPRTIQKDFTIQGTAADVTSLSFSSTAGLAPAAQAIAITAPPNAEVTYDAAQWPYVDAVNSGGSGLQSTSLVFTVSRTATGFTVQANPIWAGHYSGHIALVTPGYNPVTIALDYTVGDGVTPVGTLVTTAVATTAPAGSTADIDAYVDVVLNMAGLTEQRIEVDATNGSADPLQANWVRYWDTTPFTYGEATADNAVRVHFKLNPCFYGQHCLAAGRYTANIVYTPSAWGVSTPLTVPVTFDVTP